MRRASRRWPWVDMTWWKTSRTCPVKVGDIDTDVCLICHEGLTESFLLTLREPITTGAQKKPDLIEGIPLAPTVTSRVLLDAATHLTWSVASELDDMEASRTLVAFFLSLEGVQRRGVILSSRGPRYR